MSTSLSEKSELLAPAGNIEAFFAAMEFGADAVYVGLKEFSARAKAKNFNRDELERMIFYAQERRKKIFLAINTLVKEKELTHLIDILAMVEAQGIDAVILQDLGVWRLARKHFPELKLHASTQLTIHNTAGVMMAEQLGFSRAVLARELCLEEIAFIRSKTTLELEHFVHGAHCFSLSGQCSFSSWLGGMSGNRGRCAQPCRRRYLHKGKYGYHFSPNDLSAIEMLPELSRAGVKSFKIEGRMKSSEYVAIVVKAYRMVLDASEQMRSSAICEAKEILKQSFGRPLTQGFLPDKAPKDLINPNTQGATGKKVGKIESCQNNQLTFLTREPLHVGDRVRVQPASDKPGTAFTIRSMNQSGPPKQSVQRNELVSVGIPGGKSFHRGDLVYKISTGEVFTMSQSACRKRLENVQRGITAITLSIKIPDAQQIKLCAYYHGKFLAKSFDIETYPAETRPLSKDVLEKVFSKTGNQPLSLAELYCENLPPLVLPLSRLNAIRREFYMELASVLEKQKHQSRTENRREAINSLLPQGKTDHDAKYLSIALGNIYDLPLVKHQDAKEVILPLAPGVTNKLLLKSRKIISTPNRIVWELPVAVFDVDWPGFETEIEQLIDLGFRRFRLQNISQFMLFAKHDDLLLEGGYRLFTTNSQAACAWRDLGLSGATLYVEDDRENLSLVLKRETGLRLSVTVYANIPMMISRIPMLKNRPGQPIVSDSEESYRLETHSGMTIVRSEKDFSLLGHLKELHQMGCNHFVIDLSHIRISSAKYQKVLSAFGQDMNISGTSTFNYHKEMV